MYSTSQNITVSRRPATATGGWSIRDRGREDRGVRGVEIESINLMPMGSQDQMVVHMRLEGTSPCTTYINFRGLLQIHESGNAQGERWWSRDMTNLFGALARPTTSAITSHSAKSKESRFRRIDRKEKIAEFKNTYPHTLTGTKTQTRRQAAPSTTNDAQYYRTTTASSAKLATFTGEKDQTGVRDTLDNTSSSRGIFTGTSHYCVGTHDTASVIFRLECWLTLSKLSSNGYLLHMSGTHTNTTIVEGVGRIPRGRGAAHVHVHCITQHSTIPTHTLHEHSLVRKVHIHRHATDALVYIET